MAAAAAGTSGMAASAAAFPSVLPSSDLKVSNTHRVKDLVSVNNITGIILYGD